MLSFKDVSVQILATSPLREIPQMVVIARESPTKCPKHLGLEILVIFPEIDASVCWISKNDQLYTKMGT